MTRLRLAALAAIATLTLAGCSDSGAPASATDPREGRVTIAWSNCLYGACIYDWKVCVGADLLVNIADKEHTVKDSTECEEEAT